MMKSMFAVALLLLCLSAVDGMAFPRECVEGVTQWPVPCCPYYMGSRCGGDLNRGSCLPAPTSRAEPSPDILDDARNPVSHIFFNWTCQCKSNYMGPSCGECFFGRIGDNCEKTYNITRRNILRLNAKEREEFKAALHYCKSKTDLEYMILKTADRFRQRSTRFVDASYYDVCAFHHYYTTKPYNSNGRETSIINAAHGSTGFTTWHRYYILSFERQMQKCMQNIYWALPYYAWEYDSECLVCNDDLLGKNDYNGRISIFSVFYDWRLVCGLDFSQTICMSNDCPCERSRITRITGFTSTVKANAAAIDRCMNMPSFDTSPYDSTSRNSFRACLESAHNGYHLTHGGVMGSVPTSACDPIFFLHHNNVDKMFDRYIVRWNLTPASYPQDNTVFWHEPGACMSPFLYCCKNQDMIKPNSAFGILYED